MKGKPAKFEDMWHVHWAIAKQIDSFQHTGRHEVYYLIIVTKKEQWHEKQPYSQFLPTYYHFA